RTRIPHAERRRAAGVSWQVSGYRHRMELGGGVTGRAFLAAADDGELVVIKYLNIGEEDLDDALAEIQALTPLDPAHFVRMREIVVDRRRIALALDPVNGATLRTMLRDHGMLGAEAALYLYRHSLAGLALVHAEGVAHGDYRPENAMVDATGASWLLD